MIGKIKSVMHSDRGMTAVNLLFFLALLIPNRGIILCAYLMWSLYLVCLIRKTSSKVVRVVGGILLGFATLVVAANLFSLVGKLVG